MMFLNLEMQKMPSMPEMATITMDTDSEWNSHEEEDQAVISEGVEEEVITAEEAEVTWVIPEDVDHQLGGLNTEYLLLVYHHLVVGKT